MMTKTASQALQEGRARVAAGWGQGRNVSKDGQRYCAFEALGPLSDCPVEAQLALQRALPLGQASLAAYNDAPGRTQADILALYDRALTEVTK